jgi:glycerol-3-phosphate dehydrogenase
MPTSETKATQPRLGDINGHEFDVIIVGGGIIGAGIARDAALRGLKVVLFEKNDFGSGTTSGSTRLIHGGLRYLEMLDFRLVRIDLKEREILLRLAPHLVKPLRFLVPYYRRGFFYRWKLKLGMVLYDLLSFDKGLPGHRILSRDQTLALEPGLNPEGLSGAAVYYDAQASSPERLCIENLVDARAHETLLFNYAEVMGAVRNGSSIAGVRVKDRLEPGLEEVKVKGRVIVNASGPWFDSVAREIGPSNSRRIRTTKGAHLACLPVNREALVLFSPIDGRLFFSIPWLGYSWLSTTDTDYTDDPVNVRTSEQDAKYLIESAGQFLNGFDIEDVVFSSAGVRALVMEEGSESSVSRMHRIEVESGNEGTQLISVLGGKLTGYRAVAEEVTDHVCRLLGVDHKCQTAVAPLPGGLPLTGTHSSTSVLSAETVEHLGRLYGSRAMGVIRLAQSEARLQERLAPAYPDIAAEVVFAVREEQCVRVSDFVWRRSLLGFSRDQGMGAWASVARLMASELGHSADWNESELLSCSQFRDRTQAFQK